MTPARYLLITFCLAISLLLMASMPQHNATAQSATSTAESTAVATETIPPVIPYLSVLFAEDFSKGKPASLSEPSGNDNWRLTGEGNPAYCNETTTEWSGFSFGSKQWKDYSVQLRAKIVNWDKKASDIFNTGKLDLTVRGYVGDLIAGTRQLALGYDASGNWVGVTGNGVPFKQDTWFVLRGDVSGEHIRFYFNGRLIIDRRNKAKSVASEPSISMPPQTELCIDDIVVRSLDSTPEAVAAAKTATVKVAGSVKAGLEKTDLAIASVTKGMSVFVLDQSTDGKFTLIRIDKSGIQGWIPTNTVE